MKHLRVTYATWKEVADKNGFGAHHIDVGDGYKTFCGNVAFIYESFVSAGAEQTQFNIDFPSSELMASNDDAMANIIGIDNAPPGETVLLEEGVKGTQGYFQSFGHADDIPAVVGWHEFPALSWDYPISMFSAQAHIPDECHNDKMEFVVGQHKTIGAITANVEIGHTEISVDASALAYMRIGARVVLDTVPTDFMLGGSAEELGICTAIDEANSKITVKTAATAQHLASSPTYVKMTVIMGRELWLTEGHDYVIGQSKVGGTLIPANMPVVLRYYNADGAAKWFGFGVEYLY